MTPPSSNQVPVVCCDLPGVDLMIDGSVFLKEQISMTGDQLEKILPFIDRSKGTLRMLRLTFGLKILITVAVLLVVCYQLFFVYVLPDEYGIKVVRNGLNRGVQKEVYHAGLTFVLPFGLHQMYHLPKGIQVLELTNFPETAAHIQTSDGFFVDVDVSMLYHIKAPYLVFTTIGPDTLFEDNGIIPKAEPALKETLGKLTTGEFYNSPMRVKKAEEAKLKKIVQKGMVIAAVEMEKGKAYVTRKIDDEVARFVDEAHQRVRGILSARRTGLDDLAHLLSLNESVQGDELRQMLSAATSAAVSS